MIKGVVYMDYVKLVFDIILVVGKDNFIVVVYCVICFCFVLKDNIKVN